MGDRKEDTAERRQKQQFDVKVVGYDGDQAIYAVYGKHEGTPVLQPIEDNVGDVHRNTTNEKLLIWFLIKKCGLEKSEQDLQGILLQRRMKYKAAQQKKQAPAKPEPKSFWDSWAVFILTVGLAWIFRAIFVHKKPEKEVSKPVEVKRLY